MYVNILAIKNAVCDTQVTTAVRVHVFCVCCE